MYSCFQLREFGFGYKQLSDDDIQRINDCCRGENKFYLDQNAATIVFKDSGPCTGANNTIFMIQGVYKVE